MARRGPDRPDNGDSRRSPWRRRLAVLLGLLVVVAGGFAAWDRLDPQAPSLPELVAPGPGESSSPTPTPTPEPTPAIVGVHPPTPAPPAAVAEPLERPDLGRADREAVRQALRPGLSDPAFGPHVVARVAELSDGRTVFSSGTAPIIPASTLKLLTSTAALEALGPDHVFETRVLQGAGKQIVLVGGGDPTLASRPDSGPAIYPDRPDLQTLARQTAEALGRGATVRLRYDASLFSGPAAAPTWEADYVPDGVVAPISALWVDGGRPATGFGRVDDPAAAAAGVFRRALERRGITVAGPVRAGRAPASEAELATVASAPLGQIVERVLETSDNEGAEVLLRHVGIATSGTGSFEAGTAGVRAELGSLGVPLKGARIHDGSGLSRADRLDPATLLEVLRVAADPGHPELRAILTGLPVAGATGSLTVRFAGGALPGRGLVRAKTGTLSGVSSLAGVATDADGDTLAFVVAADRFALPDTLAVRAGLDALAADLAQCHCAHARGSGG
ncbi:D-alanyl-D-alanine carboxypeptidase/D-alanyl-D-alanine-endopeptidase [Nocardioides sp.]|uniref:D-alanyl-D-alanine carboxypeptidase/D-alanyl-D-alanine endopeptidase n=1 Tax=Nocardioides sp. TaxID=35761 RepID=UPI0035270A97